MRKTSFIATIILAPLSPSLVLGDIRTPDCVELADWARTLDFDAKRQLNPYTTYAWLEDFLGPRMVELYGKSAADFTEADSDAAAVDAKACGKTLEKADRRLLGSVEKQFDRVVGPIAKVRDASLAELDPAMAAFAATPPGLDKLRMIAAMRAIAAGDRSGATAAASGLSREGGCPRRWRPSLPRSTGPWRRSPRNTPLWRQARGRCSGGTARSRRSSVPCSA